MKTADFDSNQTQDSSILMEDCSGLESESEISFDEMTLPLEEDDGHASHDSHGGHDSHDEEEEFHSDDASKPWGPAISAALVVQAVTFAGLLVVAFTACWSRYSKARGGVHRLLIPSFAAGALLATVVFLLIPEALELLQGGHEEHEGEDEDAHEEHEGEGEDAHQDEDAHAAAFWKFGVALLCGFLLPILLGALFPAPAQVSSRDTIDNEDGESASLAAEEVNDMEEVTDWDDTKKPASTECNDLIEGASSRNAKHLRPVPLIDSNERSGPWKTIIMLGETGTGKSTTLNSMVNYLLDATYEDPFRYILVNDGPNVDQSISVTQSVSAYHFKPTVPEVSYGVTLVDAPGFNDTRGLARDEEIWHMIKSYFESELSEVDAVCFTMRSTCNRLTPSQRYVFGQILGLFGNDIKDNIFMLLTFCDGKKPPAMQAIKAAGIPCDGRCVKLNNSAFFNGFEALLDDGEISDEEDEDILLGGVDISSAFWKIGNQALRMFFTDALTKAPKTSLLLTRDVLQDREQLEITVVCLNQRIRGGLDALECVRRTVREVKSHQTDLDSHADFKIKVSKPHIKKIDLTGKGVHTTTCRTCNFTCHRQCVFANDSDKARCIAMRGGKCTSCPKQCHWTEHSNVPYWLEHSVVQVEEVALSKKAAAEAAATGISNTEAVLIEHRDKYVLLKQQLMEDTLKVHTLNNHLRTIALRTDVLDADDHFQAMIDAELQAQEPGFKARISEIQRVRQEAKVFQGVVDGGVGKKIKNMDGALRQIDHDIKEVAARYQAAADKVKRNGGRAKGWNFSLLPKWLYTGAP